MHFLPENFPPISDQPYCVYLTSATNIRLLYNLQNDNRYHSYMDYTIIGDTAIRSNYNNNAYVENTDWFSRYCLMYQDSNGESYPNKLDTVLLGRYSEYRDFWFPIVSVLSIVLIFGLIYKIMFKRFIK